MHRFDEDTAVVPIDRSEPDRSRWSGTISDRWSIAGIPTGGYVSSVALRAMLAEAPHPDPLSITTHYLQRTVPGPVDVDVAVSHRGRAQSNLEATIRQHGAVTARVLAAFGDLGQVRGPTVVRAAPPDLPAPESLPSSTDIPDLPVIARCFDFRLDPESVQGFLGRPDGEPEVAGWVRFVDGREPDVVALVTVADALPPAVLNLLTAAWVPTLEFTVHIRARPQPGWLRARFITRFLINGYLEEDGEVWDVSGRLVALSRQLALVRSADAP